MYLYYHYSLECTTNTVKCINLMDTCLNSFADKNLLLLTPTHDWSKWLNLQRAVIYKSQVLKFEIQSLPQVFSPHIHAKFMWVPYDIWFWLDFNICLALNKGPARYMIYLVRSIYQQRIVYCKSYILGCTGVYSYRNSTCVSNNWVPKW
jgi:hypothetical protein